VLGQYLALEAWLRGVECLVIERSDLERFLGLERFKGVRVEWIQEDLSPWFPFQVPYYSSSPRASLSVLFLSRVPIEEHLPYGSMTTEQRIKDMARNAPRTQKFSTGRSDRRFPTEAQIVGYLATLSSGLAAPSRRKRSGRKGAPATKPSDPGLALFATTDPQSAE
jgi:hypothetical protein